MASMQIPSEAQAGTLSALPNKSKVKQASGSVIEAAKEARET